MSLHRDSYNKRYISYISSKYQTEIRNPEQILSSNIEYLISLKIGIPLVYFIARQVAKYLKMFDVTETGDFENFFCQTS